MTASNTLHPNTLHPNNAQSDKAQFPFAALIGQPLLQRALLLTAVDPGIGGVLISGPRGTAKTTSARALAELLDNGNFVTLPLGASEEQLIGSLDLQKVLTDGSVNFRPGLLARAHEGVLYVDEVNLLPDALIDQLLDAAASGVNIIERDGISHQHPARFVLVGTMNPEEGELRPQLLDRFGLAVAVENVWDATLRRQIVAARLAFDDDAIGFRQQFHHEQQTLRESIADARRQLAAVTYSEQILAQINQLCIDARVDGLRADLVMLRAARALAALEGTANVESRHVADVAELVLLHRRNTSHDQSDIGQTQSHGSTQNPTPAPTMDLPTKNNWGELPPESVPVHPVKQVKPLPAKKS